MLALILGQTHYGLSLREKARVRLAVLGLHIVDSTFGPKTMTQSFIAGQQSGMLGSPHETSDVSKICGGRVGT